jgi:hypothetical protein
LVRPEKLCSLRKIEFRHKNIFYPSPTFSWKMLWDMPWFMRLVICLPPQEAQVQYRSIVIGIYMGHSDSESSSSSQPIRTMPLLRCLWWIWIYGISCLG